MNFSILIPHFKTGRMTAYAVAQVLKYKGRHRIEILIVDNNDGDGSIDYLKPFAQHVKIFPYPKGVLQSQGIGINFLMSHVNNEHVITMESDSFPTNETWLDYYENLINEGYESAGSLLKLSGGTYQHPAGALYKKSIWETADLYCKEMGYIYFPNMAYKEGFPCHIMVNQSEFETLYNEHLCTLTLHDSYKRLTKEEFLERAEKYKPVVCAFHNGMGLLQERYTTYGIRTAETDIPHIPVSTISNPKVIYRMGYEPGQWLHYWMVQIGTKIHNVPTEVKWMAQRENQQQEYTLMENGFKHLWGVTAYSGCEVAELRDIIDHKQKQVDELYESLPAEYKI